MVLNSGMLYVGYTSMRECGEFQSDLYLLKGRIKELERYALLLKMELELGVGLING